MAKNTGSTIGMGAGAIGGGIIGGPAGAMVGAGLGGALGGLFDSDGPQQAAPVTVDPNDPRYQLGGPNATYFGDAAKATGAREAPTTSYAQADADRARSLAARGLQEQEIGRLQGVIDGTGPQTQAQIALARGNEAAIAGGQQLAATARGTSALMQQRAANVGAVLAGQRAAADAAALRDREITAAGASLAGLASGMRGQDMGDRQQSAGQSQFLTQTEMDQRRLNDATSLGLYGLGNDQAQGQLDANVRIGQGNQSAGNGVALANMQSRSDADQRDRQARAGLYSGLASAGAGMMGSGGQPSGPAGAYGPNPYTQSGAGPAKSEQSTGGSQAGGQSGFLYKPSDDTLARGVQSPYGGLY